MTTIRTTSRAPFRKRHATLLAAATAAVALTGVTLAPSTAGASAQASAAPISVTPIAPSTSPARKASSASAAHTLAVQQAQYVRLLAFAVAVQRAQYARTLAFAVAVEQAHEHTAAAAAAAPPVPYGVWDELAGCESGGNWAINTGMFDGGLQFLPSTWRAYGGGQFAPYAYEASRNQQIAVAERVLAATGNNFRASWPACSRKLGL